MMEMVAEIQDANKKKASQESSSSVCVHFTDTQSSDLLFPFVG